MAIVLHSLGLLWGFPQNSGRACWSLGQGSSPVVPLALILCSKLLCLRCACAAECGACVRAAEYGACSACTARHTKIAFNQTSVVACMESGIPKRQTHTFQQKSIWHSRDASVHLLRQHAHWPNSSNPHVRARAHCHARWWSTRSLEKALQDRRAIASYRECRNQGARVLWLS